MGLFSTKTKTVVSSVVYNLAGDVDSRLDTTKSSIISSILTGSNEDIGTNLVGSYVRGPGMRQRQFFNWAKTNLADWMPSGVIANEQTVSDTAAVRAGMESLIALGSNETLRILTAVIDDPDLSYWAEEWVRDNRPEMLTEEWSVDLDDTTAEIVILFAGEAEIRIAGPDDFIWAMADNSRRLLFVDYTRITIDPATGDATESAPDMWVYRMGSGTAALDSLAQSGTSISEFYPVIPLRLNNKSVRDAGLEETYTLSKKAFKKLTGTKIDVMLDTLEANDDIGEIDYAFMVQGVSLNTEAAIGREYLYKFFKTLMENQHTNRDDLAAYFASKKTTAASQTAVDLFLTSPASAFTDSGSILSALFGSIPSASNLRVYSSGLSSFDYRISWNSIRESQFVGNAKHYDGDTSRTAADIGEYWFTKGTVLNGLNRIYFFHQHSRYAYSVLEIVGLTHKNFVYAGKSVTITGTEALDDTEESGFLLPLHYPTLKNMSARKVSQLATSSSYLVLNCYQQYKIKWYQRGIFKVILVIVAIGISIFFPPAGGLANSVGILGTNLAVGTALGFTAMTAAIIGAAVNAVAAMILVSVISRVSTELLGEKIGAIVTAIATVVIGGYTSGTFGGEAGFDFSSLFKPDMLLKMTDAVTGAISEILRLDAQETYGKLDRLRTDYEAELEKIQELSDEILGSTNVVFDPIMLTDATEHFGETRKTFTARTLLTGSDISTISLAMIGDFPSLSLELPKALV